jgi:hypothetical protein
VNREQQAGPLAAVGLLASGRSPAPSRRSEHPYWSWVFLLTLFRRLRQRYVAGTMQTILTRIGRTKRSGNAPSVVLRNILCGFTPPPPGWRATGYDPADCAVVISVALPGSPAAAAGQGRGPVDLGQGRR